VTESTIGANDAKEFGSIEDSIEAMGLLEMDVYHHIVSGEKYPAVLATAGINDGRVPAWEAGKMIASMQQASASGKPVFLQVNYNSGHNSSDKLVQFKALADKFAFAIWQVGHKDFQIKSD
jgi:prolyl oligopeptidase